jgi:hypothetical protein
VIVESDVVKVVGWISEAHPALTLIDPAVSPDALRLSGLPGLVCWFFT